MLMSGDLKRMPDKYNSQCTPVHMQRKYCIRTNIMSSTKGTTAGSNPVQNQPQAITLLEAVSEKHMEPWVRAAKRLLQRAASKRPPNNDPVKYVLHTVHQAVCENIQLLLNIWHPSG